MLAQGPFASRCYESVGESTNSVIVSTRALPNGVKSASVIRYASHNVAIPLRRPRKAATRKDHSLWTGHIVAFLIGFAALVFYGEKSNAWRTVIIGFRRPLRCWRLSVESHAWMLVFQETNGKVRNCSLSPSDPTSTLAPPSLNHSSLPHVTLY